VALLDALANVIVLVLRCPGSRSPTHDAGIAGLVKQQWRSDDAHSRFDSLSCARVQRSFHIRAKH
jgi:hypothetical protein